MSPASVPIPEKASQAAVGEGTELGRYRLIRKLGEGGMGVVYEAEHRELGRKVAIKVLRTGTTSSDIQAARFQREAELVSRIGHPNIVEIYDFGRTSDGNLYFVMELLHGESLRSRLRTRPLSDREIAEIFAPLLSAIAAAHSQGIVHRDLKPDNVMLGDAGVKLLDFGVAKNLSQQGADMTTVSGALLGTPAYMAPEQIRHSSHVDARADIYAAAVMLYEALTGQRPFVGNAIELLSKQLFESVVPPSEVARQQRIERPNIDWPTMDRIVLRGLCKEPEGRYPEVGTFLHELQTAWPRVEVPDLSGKHSLGETAASGNSIPEDHRSSLLQRLKMVRLVALGAVLALLGAGLLWRLLRNPMPSQKPSMQVQAQSPTDSEHSPAERAQQRILAALAGPREERRALALAMADVGGSALHDRLLQLLRDPEPAVAKAALQAAGSYGVAVDPAMIAALKQLGEQAGGALGVDAMTARLGLGDTTVVAGLSAAVAKPSLDVEVRLRAQLALVQAGALKPSALRAAVLQSVEQGGLRPTLYRRALRELLRLKDPGTVKRLDRALTDANPNLRSEAAEVLSLLGRRDGQDALYQLAMQHPDELSFRTLLAESGDVRAKELLRPRLSDPSGMVRQKAVAALAALSVHGGRPCDVSLVVPLLRDADALVRLSAAVAFVQLDRCQRAEATATP